MKEVNPEELGKSIQMGRAVWRAIRAALLEDEQHTITVPVTLEDGAVVVFTVRVERKAE